MLLELVNFIHFLGLAFGLGGATIATIISAKASRDRDLEKSVMKIMPSIVKLIWIGMILLIISGIALPFLISWPMNSQMLIVKHVLVAWIVIIGVIMGFRMKKMKAFAREKSLTHLLKVKKQMKILSIINLILWYVVTLLSAFV